MSLVTAIKITQKQVGIFEEAHKLNVLDVSKQKTDSCTQLTHKQQAELLARYKSMLPKSESKFIFPAQLRLIYSLWKQLHIAGGVDINSKQACDTFCEKYLKGRTLLQSKDQWSSIIEVQKAWLTRCKKEGQANASK